jgi:hypothetical protein
MRISRETFDQQRRPRFGTANPERMQLAFWEWMIRGHYTPPPDDGCVLGRLGMMMREGILKSAYGPYRARDLFQVPLNRDDGPIWTFDRMGSTRTELPDGRVVCVGGEHEDYYDPDFCIYNDVVVFAPDDRIEIYGYPREVFPATDFHTASLVGKRVMLIGCLGYPDDRRPDHTPVYALDTDGYRIAPVDTTGPAPGWLFKHEAAVGADGVITVKGGEVIQERNGRRRYRQNFDDYSLEPASGVWRRLTDRQWSQFSIHRDGHESFPLELRIEPEGLFPTDVSDAEMLGVSDDRPSEGWFRVQGCPVSVTVGWRYIEVVVHGPLPTEAATLFVDAIRARFEALVQHPCVFEQV